MAEGLIEGQPSPGSQGRRGPGRPRSTGDNVRKYRSREKERIQSLTKLTQRLQCRQTELKYDVHTLTKQRDELQRCIEEHIRSTGCKISNGQTTTGILSQDNNHRPTVLPEVTETCVFSTSDLGLGEHIQLTYLFSSPTTMSAHTSTNACQPIKQPNMITANVVKAEPISPTSYPNFAGSAGIPVNKTERNQPTVRRPSSSRSVLENNLFLMKPANDISDGKPLNSPNNTLTFSVSNSQWPQSIPKMTMPIGTIGSLQSSTFPHIQYPEVGTVGDVRAARESTSSTGSASSSMRETHQLLASLQGEVGEVDPMDDDGPQMNTQQSAPWSSQNTGPCEGNNFHMSIANGSQLTGSLQSPTSTLITASTRPFAPSSRSFSPTDAQKTIGTTCTEKHNTRIPSVIEALEDEEVQIIHHDQNEAQTQAVTQSCGTVSTISSTSVSEPVRVTEMVMGTATPDVGHRSAVQSLLEAENAQKRLTPVSSLIDTYLNSPGDFNKDLEEDLMNK